MPRARTSRSRRAAPAAPAYQPAGILGGAVRTYDTRTGNVTTGGGIISAPPSRAKQVLMGTGSLPNFLPGEVISTNPPTPVDILPPVTPADVAFCVGRDSGAMEWLPLTDLRVTALTGARTARR